MHCCLGRDGTGQLAVGVPRWSASNEQNPTLDKNIAGTIILTITADGNSSRIEHEVRNNLEC